MIFLLTNNVLISVYNLIHFAPMKLIKVKTMHIINHECDMLKTLKVFTIFGFVIFTKIVEPQHYL